MVRIAGLKYIAVLAGLAALASSAALYASHEKRYDLPIIATVTLVWESGSDAADVDKDGLVNARDLLIITQNINTSPPRDPRADVDGNGAVDLKDLASVAVHFGS